MKKRPGLWPLTLGLWSVVAAGCGAYDAVDDLPPHGDAGVTTTRAALVSDSMLYAQKSLMVTALSVVNNAARTSDPCTAVPGDASKKWTFGYLMTQAANQSATGVSAVSFVNGWLKTMTSVQPDVNGQELPILQFPGLGREVQDNWRARSGGTALQMQHAPFRLLAIAPRFDLRKRRRFGEGIAGELRFIFSTLRSQEKEPNSNKCLLGETTVIFEYAVDKADENQVLKWIKDWNTLSTYQLGSSQYLAALETLTESVVRAGVSPSRPNGSALVRVRTQENTDASGTWFFREWALDSKTHLLVPKPLKQSPKTNLIPATLDPDANAQTIGKWINENEAAILNDTYVVPEQYPIVGHENHQYPVPPGGAPPDYGSAFLGAFERNSTNEPRVIRSSSINNNEARHLFAKGTCVGCHSRETANGSVFHVTPRDSDKEALLSQFLTGNSDGSYYETSDPVDGTTRYFNELLDRKNDVNNVVNGLPVTPPVWDIGYKIRVRHDGKCLDLPSSSKTVGVGLQQWDCNGNQNQRLRVTSLADSYVNMRFKHSSQCLEASGPSNTVVQKACTGNSSQMLRMERVRGLGYIFRFANNDRCLEVLNASTANGAKIVHNTCTYANNQVMEFFE